MRTLSLLVGLALLGPAALSAQLAWDGPALIGPASPAGFALFLSDPDPGGDLAVTAAWRHRQGALDIGYRATLGEDSVDGLAIAGGVDVSGPLARGIEDADVDIIWWSGAGAGIGEELMVSVPLGIAVGWAGVGDGVIFAPYAGGHVSLDMTTGAGDALDLNAAIDLGIDLTLGSGWVVRAGAALGSRESLAIGVRVPSGTARRRN